MNEITSSPEDLFPELNASGSIEASSRENVPVENGLVDATRNEKATEPLPVDLGLVLDIPVRMTVELGRVKMTIKELLQITQGAVITLDGLVGEPLDILINGYLIAQGEAVVVSDRFGIRITDIITPSERVNRATRS